VSDERFSVYGTLIEAWASIKSFSFRKKDEPPTPPGGEADQARCWRRGETAACDARASENRNGLLVLLDVKQAVATRYFGFLLRIALMADCVDVDENRHAEDSSETEKEERYADLETPARHILLPGADLESDVRGDERDRDWNNVVTFHN
jgi:hypothetical protein